jgi:hypothetical protein
MVMNMTQTNQTWHPQFTAALLLERPASISFAQLKTELNRIAPQATLGDWSGPIADPSPETGIELISLNGEKMSVLVVDAPAPAAILQPGPFPNPLWPNATTEAARHKAHIVVIGLGDPIDRVAALAKARAVTLVAAAIARLVPAIGACWVDGANLVKADTFISITENIGQADANAVPFWIRLMVARAQPGQNGEDMTVGATLGLRAFGLREVEYAPVSIEPNFIMQHAYSVSDYLIRSGKSLSSGETIGVTEQIGFAISHADKGNFSSSPVAYLSLVTHPKTK